MSRIEQGSRFTFHDARGTRGPYTVDEISGTGAAGFSPVCRLSRDGTEKVAWATERWLREGVDKRGVGWEPIE